MIGLALTLVMLGYWINRNAPAPAVVRVPAAKVPPRQR